MKRLLATFGILFFSSFARAKIYLDFEPDPLPLIKVNALVPSSRMILSDVENLSIAFLEEIYDSGTSRLNRQELQDVLASFGASLKISLGFQYADLSITFPLDQGKVPADLGTLVHEVWTKPRLSSENFERTSKHLKANHLAKLDRDASLLTLALQKFMSTQIFGLTPYSTESFSRITLAGLTQFKADFYQDQGDIWVGIIAPEQKKAELTTWVQGIFPKSGAVEYGIYKKSLKSGYQPALKKKVSPTFILVDKHDLAQIHYGFLNVDSAKRQSSTELVHSFTYYVLAGAGIESVFGNRIREERGLSYAVSGILSEFYEYPILSLYANPQRNKQAEAMEVLKQLIDESVFQGSIVNKIPDRRWNTWLQAFQNSERQVGATPEGRIGRRKSVARGDMSYELYKTPVDEWNVKKSQSSKRLAELSSSASLIVGAIGDATELKPLVQKHFPNYQLRSVNYKEVIENGWLK